MGPMLAFWYCSQDHVYRTGLVHPEARNVSKASDAVLSSRTCQLKVVLPSHGMPSVSCHHACPVTRGDGTFRLRQHTAGAHLQSRIFDAQSFAYREVTERVIIVTVSCVSPAVWYFRSYGLSCTES